MGDKQRTRAVFAALQSEAANQRCVDCQRRNPQWASISHGVFVCIQCSGVHRSFGVHISFVRSCTMDAWSEKQLNMMKALFERTTARSSPLQAGGNKRLQDFFKSQGFPSTLSAYQKYHAGATIQYRKWLKDTAEGRHPAPLPRIGYQPPAPNPARAAPKPAMSRQYHGHGGGASKPRTSSSASAVKELGAQATVAVGGLLSSAAELTQKASVGLTVQGRAAAEFLSSTGRGLAQSVQHTTAELLREKEFLEHIKQGGSKGWSAVSGFLSSAGGWVRDVTANVTIGVANDGAVAIPRAFGLQPPGRPSAPPPSSQRQSSDPRADRRTEPRANPRADPRADLRSEPRVNPRAEMRAKPRAQPRVEPVRAPAAVGEPTSPWDQWDELEADTTTEKQPEKPAVVKVEDRESEAKEIDLDSWDW